MIALWREQTGGVKACSFMKSKVTKGKCERKVHGVCKKKVLGKKVLSIIATVALTVQCFCSPMAAQTVQAETTESTIETLVTKYQPTINGKTSASGLKHPGVGLTEELLNNVQTQVRNEAEPWKTYFEAMLASSAASKTPKINLTDPANSAFNSQSFNSKFIGDALTAYTQAILYYVTGDNVYRKNAINIFRAWAQLDPEKYAPFPDCVIHVGIPMNRMCNAAEIIRYSSYTVTDGYKDEDLNWTESEIEAFITNLVEPAVNTFMSSNDEFMNQHNYTVLGAMSAYLFMDDMEGYAKTVEWFTVNEDGANPGFNGSIKRLFREITHIDEIGQAENSGEELAKPVVQHVEMGRDQAHGCGDLTNATIMARLMRGQGTKVDPVTGQVSTKGDAVDVYEFLDDRILKTADFFFEYMLGYDADWVPVPFSIIDGKIKDLYTAFSPEYRGRYKTINFWDLYTYYTYITEDEVDLENEYPYFYEGFMKKVASNYYWNGELVINWDNVDFGGDFWLYLPAAAKDDAKLLVEEPVDYLIEVETRGSLVENKEAMSVVEENGVEYVRFTQSQADSKLAIHSGGVANQTIAFRIRTNGEAKLSLSNGVSGSIHVPDTNGEWQYVTFTRDVSEGFGDLYYVIISDITGSYVDIDAIDIKPGESNNSRTIDVLSFESGNGDVRLVTCAGAPLSISFAATDSVAEQTISYEGIDLPAGLSVNGSGLLTGTPAAGNYSFYVKAKANATGILKKVELEVTADRNTAISNAIASYDADAVYTSASLDNYETTLSATRDMVNSASDTEFAAQLNVLCEAVANLALVSPLLVNDPYTDGTSLDYAKLVYDSTMGSQIYRLADGIDTYCEYTTSVDGAHIMDFGPDFKVSVTRFGYKARLGFSDRLAGVQVFGSNDKKEWTQLTVGEAEYTQNYHEVDVINGEQSNKYRFLMIKKTTEYPDALREKYSNLLEFGELRIYGTRHETGNKIKSVSISSEQAVGGRISSGDTVKLTITATEQISDVNVTIHGVNAVVEQGSAANEWIASAIMPEKCSMGSVEIAIDYKKSDTTAGDTFIETTDGSYLYMVDSEKRIDVAEEAYEITSVEPTRGEYTAEQNAEFLFDGILTDANSNKNNFGEVKNGSGYYTIDFGNGTKMCLEAVMFYPRSDGRENIAKRLNGVKVYGSNDGSAWTQITKAVTDAAMYQWAMISDSDIISKDSYRYFKISGAEYGNMGEVEFYGTELIDLIQEKATLSNQTEGANAQEAGISNLFDGDVNTHIEFNGEEDNGHRSYIIFDMGEGRSIVLDKAEMAARVDWGERLAGAVLQGSNTNDGTDWVTITEAAVDVEGWQEVAIIGSSEAYRYLRLYNPGCWYGNIAELRVYGNKTIGLVDLSQVKAMRSDQTQGANAEEAGISNIFDNNPATYTEFKGEANNGHNSYIVFDMGEGKSIVLGKVEMQARADQVSRLKGAVLQGSNTNDGSDWVTITAKAVETQDLQEVAVTDSSTGYRYLRLYNQAFWFGNISELRVYGIVKEGVPVAPTATPEPTSAPTATPEPTTAPVSNGWDVVDGMQFWYEDGVLQGTEGRGKEIYDPETNAWYWLDSVLGGAVAKSKDVY